MTGKQPDESRETTGACWHTREKLEEALSEIAILKARIAELEAKHPAQGALEL